VFDDRGLGVPAYSRYADDAGLALRGEPAGLHLLAAPEFEEHEYVVGEGIIRTYLA
jgi:hypothetical protein